ncbi:MAG: glycosyltransferase family 2 protein [Patescibacteria group bacterium]
METSIIIRTKNEERYLEQVLKKLKEQTYQNFEIIIVDDNSTDRTIEIAQKYNCEIINIPRGKFTHPYSCNLGAEKAQGRYIVYLNGHSIPISQEWLEHGIKNFEDKKVAGVYAMIIAHKDGTLTDKLIYNLVGYTIGMFRRELTDVGIGLLGTTNAIIRKDLWETYNFPEVNDGFGGEDAAWALHFMKQGYKIVHDPKFKVRHSHHLKMKDFFWQRKNWKQMKAEGGGKPKKQRKNF